MCKIYPLLTLSALCISESCIKTKINLNIYFHTSLWCLKRFYKASKAFMKPFEATQRKMKIEIESNFLSLSGIGTGRVNFHQSKVFIKTEVDWVIKKGSINTLVPGVH